MRLIKGWSDWHVHPITYLYLLAAWWVGCFRTYFLLLFIVSFHELGHYLVAKYYCFEIKQVLLLPFGAFIQLDDFGFHRIEEELLVVLGGLCMHAFLFLVPNNEFQYLQQTVLFFNILPIYPLDGSKILLLLFSYVMDFQKAILLQIYISLFCLSVFIVWYYETSYFIIYIYLIYHISKYYLTYPLYIKKLILQRINILPFLKEKVVLDTNFYRAYHNVYHNKNHLISEINYTSVLLNRYSKQK